MPHSDRFIPTGHSKCFFDPPGTEALFALVRTSPDGDEKIICIHNVSNAPQPFQVNLKALSIQHTAVLRDTISGTSYPVSDGDDLTLTVGPYEVLWLKAQE